jgi:hypothetical protein
MRLHSGNNDVEVMDLVSYGFNSEFENFDDDY